MPEPPDLLDSKSIAQKLKKRNKAPYEFPNPEIFTPGPSRPAAVLIPLLWHNDEWELVFIRRSKVEGDPHSGQVAFPGGRADQDDVSFQATALREAKEEIGLLEENVEILGEMEHMLTISNYKLTPVVARLKKWPIKFRAQETEVARIFCVPLKWLQDPSHLRVEKREIPNSSVSAPVYYFDEFDGELLWGVTAHIVVNFIEALEE